MFDIETKVVYMTHPAVSDKSEEHENASDDRRLPSLVAAGKVLLRIRHPEQHEEDADHEAEGIGGHQKVLEDAELFAATLCHGERGEQVMEEEDSFEGAGSWKRGERLEQHASSRSKFPSLPLQPHPVSKPENQG